MTNLFKAGTLLFLINSNLTGEFNRHKQICSGLFAVDRTWQLSIKSNNTFAYNITTINTKSSKRETREIFEGNWELRNDTLTLMESKKKISFSFLIDKNKIIPVNQKPDTLGSFVMSLDYLEKSELAK
ncbi:hypothetical protein HHL16_12665 [Pseudoflavitalea sp. G-6-1-2]|uniref:hypothetical protein n=1 Tax=Pseudoflavitalea sp. G-6-1-2 TaxID=2728841 RepID=UPI00146F1A93|nr:hypothetical protein [Pseudoflavitalea sp. G-6-1-2]NML21735.1 hypothetical protein [Pseudoflavitalea sp. G-6-1-2]